MADNVILLSSDTETKPTPAMRQAIATAEVGDEQRGEDPTVNRLQDRVAELLGKEAALWFPGGTMCNIVAVKVHTNPANAIIADWMAHIIRAESASAALASGVLIEPIRTERGIFTPVELEAAIGRLTTVPIPYGQAAALVCVEQTHNLGGGTVWSLDELRAVCKTARTHGVPIHMDGARLLNAIAATEVPLSTFAAEVDSLWIDFTKGLGAPIGAVMAGTKDFISRARRFKHVFGGAMRQAGIAAAGCLHALDYHVDRLNEDHEHAQILASGLAQIDGIRVRTPKPESNMVFFDASGLGLSNVEFLQEMESHGIRLGMVGNEIRAVTHLDVPRSGIDRALSAAATIAKQHSK
jgi:threonine aldolase